MLQMPATTVSHGSTGGPSRRQPVPSAGAIPFAIAGGVVRASVRSVPARAFMMSLSFRNGFPSDAAVHGARALVFVAFVILCTPAFLYEILPVLRRVQTILWWCATLILLLSTFLATRIADCPQRAGDETENRATRATPGFLFLFGGLAMLIVGYWHFVHLADLHSRPIDSSVADMLPLLLSGFADLDQWVSPYRPHDVPWTLTNYYLPLTFLPYYLAYKCGIDIRYVNLACFALVSLVLLLLWPRAGSRARGALFFGYWAVTVSAFHAVIDAHQFTRIIHLGPYWLYLTVAYVMLVLRRPYAFACGMLCALAARETAVFHVVPLGVALLRFQQSTARVLVAVVPTGLFALFLPFFIDNPSFYAGNIAQYSSLGWVIEESGGYHFVGLAGLLNRVGLMDFRWLFLGAGMAICLRLYLVRARSWNYGHVLFLCFCCTNVSAVFALVPWPYLTVPSLLILIVFMLHDFSGRTAHWTTDRKRKPARALRR